METNIFSKYNFKLNCVWILLPKSVYLTANIAKLSLAQFWSSFSWAGLRLTLLLQYPAGHPSHPHLWKYNLSHKNHAGGNQVVFLFVTP